MLIEVLCDLPQVITIRTMKVLFDHVSKFGCLLTGLAEGAFRLCAEKRVHPGIEPKRCYLINILRQVWFLFYT